MAAGADLLSVLAFSAGHNSAVAMAGAIALGAGAGTIGTFVLPRGQALLGEAIAHATLPGVALAFLAGLALAGEGRNVAALTAGAAAAGALAVLAARWIAARTRLSGDAAIATVLSVFYGAGAVLLSHIQALPAGGRAGLDGFLLGSVATMTADEALALALAALAVVGVALLFFKEFAIVCFDAAHAATLGLPVRRLDLAMTGLLLAVVAIGLETAGLVLVVALVIVPPVTARFWVARFGPMAAVSAFAGALACYVGGAISAAVPGAPAGAVIVLAAGAGCALSFCLAPRRGLVARLRRGRGFGRDGAPAPGGPS